MVGLTVRSLYKAFPIRDGREKLALANVNLDVEPGQFVCILGPSGCGKTTLFNILSGLDPAYRGTVRFIGTGGLMGGESRPAPRIGYVFQEARLLPWLTVRENLRFVLDRGRRTPGVTEQLDRWLARVGLEGYEDYYPGQLSVGMQQRVSVARALIIEPDILLMDEPFSALDELTALQIRQELLDLWRERACTVLFVTHNPLEAVYLADRVLVMSPSPGRIIAQIPLSESLPRPRDPDDERLWHFSRQAVRLLHSRP